MPGAEIKARSAAEVELQRRLMQAERELERLRGELLHADRLATLGTLAAHIAHELNNLMTPVLSYGRAALARDVPDPMVKKALERAVSGADRATRVARSILDLSRRTPGEVPRAMLRPDAEPFEAVNDERACPRSCFDAAILCLASDPAREGIEVRIEGPEPPPTVAIEPGALQQVLLNLVLNARKAMLPPARGGTNPAGRGGVLTFTVRPPLRRESDRRAAEAAGEGSTWNAVRLTLTDTGKGIEPHRIKDVFEPFVTYSGSPDTPERLTPGPGTGLGLALCKRLIEHAGGRISAKSEPSRGTTITIDLPPAR